MNVDWTVCLAILGMVVVVFGAAMMLRCRSDGMLDEPSPREVKRAQADTHHAPFVYSDYDGGSGGGDCSGSCGGGGGCD